MKLVREMLSTTLSTMYKNIHTYRIDRQINEDSSVLWNIVLVPFLFLTLTISFCILLYTLDIDVTFHFVNAGSCIQRNWGYTLQKPILFYYIMTYSKCQTEISFITWSNKPVCPFIQWGVLHRRVKKILFIDDCYFDLLK